MKIPNWLNSYLDNNDLNDIEEAVKKAELKTSGEIIPMIARSSSTVGHVPLLLALLLLTIFFSIDLFELQSEYLHFQEWVLVILNLVTLVFLMRLFSRLGFIQRWLTPRGDQVAQVEMRAMNEFYNHRIQDTKHSTGILIFISLLEHNAVVLGDTPISEKLPAEKWNEVVSCLIKGVKSKNLKQGYVDAIEMCGDLLSQHFPIHKNDVNELENRLIIKE